jgi:putative resolvase
MLMERYYCISVAAQLLGVCTKTIWRWDAAGKLLYRRTPGGHRRIEHAAISALLAGMPSPPSHRDLGAIAIYGRVSSHEQKTKGDLERQIATAVAFCMNQGLQVRYILQDVSSGLNTHRTGLTKLCRLIERRQVARVVITYKDRLTRFGFEYLEAYFNSHGAVIEPIQQLPSNSLQEELVQDLIAIITAFSGRVHGLRSHQHTRTQKNATNSRKMPDQT